MTAETPPTRRDAEAGRAWTWLFGIAGVIGLAIVAVVVYGVWFDDDAEAAEALAVGVTVNDVTEDPDAYIGQTVTVSGQVASVPHEHAVVIGGDEFFGGEELLIVAPEPIPLPPGAERTDDVSVLEGDIIQVTGTVTYFESDSFTGPNDDEINDLIESMLEDSELIEFQGDPAIVADDVSLTLRVSDTAARAYSVEDVIGHGETLAGTELTLSGNVEMLISDQAFTMSESDVLDDVGFEETLLVVAETGVIPQDLVEDAIVTVEGTVREFDVDDPGALGTAYAALYDDDLVAAYDDRAIIVADSVTTDLGEQAVSFEDVVSSTAFLGETVTINGEIEDVVTSQAFSIVPTDDDSVVGDTEILVVGPEDVFQKPITEDAFAVVTGTLQTFDEEMQRDLGFGVDLQDDVFAEWQDGLIITLDSLKIEK